MRYFIELSYNGSSFHGWQKQPNAVSVQSVLEDALSKVLRVPIDITAAGRTDAGVHARQMFAHFNSEKELEDIPVIINSLNSMVGRNIAVKRIYNVSEYMHARFDAKERTYKYFVTYNKSPFNKDFCWHSPTKLDMDKMNEAAKILLSTSDFTSFAKLHSDNKTNICDVREAFWQSVANDLEARDLLGNFGDGIVFTIKADRFLRNMVRAIVGTLVEVGRGKIKSEDFQEIVLKKNRGCAGTSMPPQALFLWEIKY